MLLILAMTVAPAVGGNIFIGPMMPPQTGFKACTNGLRCKRKCEEEDSGDDCFSAGTYFLNKGKQRTAYELYDRGCKLRHWPSCSSVGQMRMTAPDPNMNRQGRKDLQAACNKGVLSACYNFALMLSYGQRLVANPRMAVEKWKLYCTRQRHDVSCVRVAIAGGDQASSPVPPSVQSSLEKGCGWASDRAASKRDYRARTGGLACAALGNVLQVDGNPSDAVAAYRKACTAGVQRGCFEVGRAYQSGHGVSRNLREAAEFYRLACPEVREACEAAKLARARAGAEKSGDTADLIALECRNGDGEACQQIGEKAEAAGDLKRAADFYDAGCRDNAFSACVRRAALAEAQATPDYRHAGMLYDMACAAGDGEGCVGFGAMYEHGKGMPKDVVEATVLYRRGCDLGTDHGCRAAKSMSRTLQDRVKEAVAPQQPVPGNRCGGNVSLDPCLQTKTLEELTLIETLLVASGVNSPKELDKRAAALETMSQRIAHLARATSADEASLATQINRVMHALYLREYQPGVGDMRVTLDRGVYNCLTSTLIYILAAKRAGLAAAGFVMKGHVLAVTFGGGAPLYVETTAPGLDAADTWSPPLPAFDPNAYREARRAAVRDLGDMESAQMTGEDEAAEESWEAGRKKVFTAFYQRWGLATEIANSAHDVNHRELASLLYWNRALTAASQGRAKEAGEATVGMLALGTKTMSESMLALRFVELRAFLIGLGKGRNWKSAVSTIDVLARALSDERSQLAVRDLRASIYSAWLAEPGRRSKCDIVSDFAETDPAHPVIGPMRKNHGC